MQIHWKQIAHGSVLLLFAGVTLVAAGTTDSKPVEKQVQKHVQKQVIVRCDSDNCPDAADAQKVFIVKEEDTGKGTGFAWHSATGADGAHHAIFIGDSSSEGAQGASWLPMTDQLRQHFGVSTDSGVMVSAVKADSPAAKAGLLVGDIVTTADGKDMVSPAQLNHLFAARAGEPVALEVWRNGKVEKLSLTPTAESRHELKRVIEVDCTDSDDGCAGNWVADRMDACGDSEQCNVNVNCHDGDCDCSVNGKSVDCKGLGN